LTLFTSLAALDQAVGDVRLIAAFHASTPDSAADATFDNYSASEMTMPPQLKIDRAAVLTCRLTWNGVNP